MTNEEMLSQIDGKVDKLLQWKSALDERCSAHRELTDEARQTIYGNPGKSDGLQFDVSRLVNCKVAISRRKQFWSYVLRAVIIVLIVGLISGAINLLTLYLKG